MPLKIRRWDGEGIRIAPAAGPVEIRVHRDYCKGRRTVITITGATGVEKIGIDKPPPRDK